MARRTCLTILALAFMAGAAVLHAEQSGPRVHRVAATPQAVVTIPKGIFIR